MAGTWQQRRRNNEVDRPTFFPNRPDYFPQVLSSSLFLSGISYPSLGWKWLWHSCLSAGQTYTFVMHGRYLDGTVLGDMCGCARKGHRHPSNDRRIDKCGANISLITRKQLNR
ncbi:hypothetical protein J6590_015991 [Homalodisca vitripennis]|nr:hypothetical protein J6590_015991 [Homalodisca vitripennis]